MVSEFTCCGAGRPHLVNHSPSQFLDLVRRQKVCALLCGEDHGEIFDLVTACRALIVDNDVDRYIRIDYETINTEPHRLLDLLESSEGFFSSASLLIHISSVPEAAAKSMQKFADATVDSPHTLLFTAGNLKANGNLRKQFAQSRDLTCVVTQHHDVTRTAKLVDEYKLHQMVTTEAAEWINETFHHIDSGVARLELEKLRLLSFADRALDLSTVKESMQNETEITVEQWIDWVFLGKIEWIQSRYQQGNTIPSELLVRSIINHILTLLFSQSAFSPPGWQYRVATSRKEQIRLQNAVWSPRQLHSALKLTLQTHFKLRSPIEQADLACTYLLYTITRMAQGR